MRNLLALVARVSIFAFLLAQAAGAAHGAAADLRLVDAAGQQDWQQVRSLLDAGADVNTPRADGVTALLWAAHWNDIGAVEVLLNAGADPNASDDHGVTPLMRGERERER